MSDKIILSDKTDSVSLIKNNGILSTSQILSSTYSNIIKDILNSCKSTETINILKLFNEFFITIQIKILPENSKIYDFLKDTLDENSMNIIIKNIFTEIDKLKEKIKEYNDLSNFKKKIENNQETFLKKMEENNQKFLDQIKEQIISNKQNITPYKENIIKKQKYPNDFTKTIFNIKSKNNRKTINNIYRLKNIPTLYSQPNLFLENNKQNSNYSLPPITITKIQSHSPNLYNL